MSEDSSAFPGVAVADSPDGRLVSAEFTEKEFYYGFQVAL